VLLRLAYLAAANGLAMLRLAAVSDRTKDVEILALRHQITVLERLLHGQGRKIRFAAADRAFLAALLHRLPRHVLLRMRLVVRPETVLRWHRDLIAARHARMPPAEAGRSAAHGPVDQAPGFTFGAGEQHVGLSPYPRRAAGSGHQGRGVHGVGDP
jgi:hypothetical protein